MGKIQQTVESKLLTTLKPNPTNDEVAMWFSIGKQLLQQVGGSGKRRITQLKIATVAKLFREIDEGKQSRPYKKRKRTGVAV
ncbi:hypothetical protein DYB25_006669 [Aphanomyces astaci]|uniref:Uncharacterized protein n=1 Tax=Aphanomyces astaci TaxID=112090 RepID=A0A397A2K1_APHAT|nr:hypothetical protein DYB25_006669 [Aphanomyces astaci]RHY03471.1 hypothetical protein DYB36_009001 [Aphanomyces astaci]RHY43402.1 hypothetical protein DYB38_011861 [Aphanomyces astaci]RHY82195.1 hypothetical protein DYB31_010793 [Aphanomyces astaci]RHZ38025.1 hypothetical protein DYB26_012586 [Aphanomyces astaci]